MSISSAIYPQQTLVSRRHTGYRALLYFYLHHSSNGPFLKTSCDKLRRGPHLIIFGLVFTFFTTDLSRFDVVNRRFRKFHQLAVT